MFFALTFLFGSTFQAGWALAECGQVGLVLDKKLGWNAFGKDEE
jgi:MFS family permease